MEPKPFSRLAFLLVGQFCALFTVLTLNVAGTNPALAWAIGSGVYFGWLAVRHDTRARQQVDR